MRKDPWIGEGFGSETVDFSELNYVSFSIRIVLTNPPAVP